MNRFGIIFLGVFVWALLALPGGAWAHSTHASVQAQSPFDSAKAKKPVHCVLKGHHHAGQPYCPHTAQVRDVKRQYKADCGDSPSGTRVHAPDSKSFLLFPSVGRASSTIKKYILPRRQVFPISPIPDPLERPPQHI